MEFPPRALNPTQRSHYVIVDGGDQPNVVPPAATVWYFVREVDAPGIRQNFDTLQRIAEGAALMTDTTLRRRIVGAAWPRHFNRPMALAMQANIEGVGMPHWSEQDQTFARALQQLLEVPQNGLATEVQPVAEPSMETGVRRLRRHRRRLVGRADGDPVISVERAGHDGPSLVERNGDGYADRAQGRDGRGESRRGNVARPAGRRGLRAEAQRYFRDEQLSGTAYEPFIGPDDAPPIEKNREIMAEFLERLRSSITTQRASIPTSSSSASSIRSSRSPRAEAGVQDGSLKSRGRRRTIVANRSWGIAVRRFLLSLFAAPLLFAVAPQALEAQPPPGGGPGPQGGFGGFGQMEARALAEPFKGVTTNGTVTPGLYSIRSTGVSTEPVVRAANAFIAALTPEQRAKTQYPVDDDEWRKWANVHLLSAPGRLVRRDGAAAESRCARIARGVAERERA